VVKPVISFPVFGIMKGSRSVRGQRRRGADSLDFMFGARALCPDASTAMGRDSQVIMAGTGLALAPSGIPASPGPETVWTA